jgi:RNA polymerase sigma-70 factor, ECF subfamily
LGPAERGAYLLRKAFDYPYSRIAQVLPISAVHARQLVRRAQLKLCSTNPQPVNSADHRCLVRAFLAAAQHGEFLSLELLLAADIQHGGA